MQHRNFYAVEPHDREVFVRALMGVAEIHSKKLSAFQIELYWNVLTAYPVGDVTTAMERHMADPDVGQFMPKPADIIRQIAGSGDTQAMLAWTKVEKAMRTVGSYRSVVFDDWKIHAVVRDMGGWLALCEMNTDELPFRAREFEKRYRGYTTSQAYPPKLIGRSEAYNQAEGYEKFVEPPVLIGNQERALLVHDRGTESSRQLQVGEMPIVRLIGRVPKGDAA